MKIYKDMYGGIIVAVIIAILSLLNNWLLACYIFYVIWYILLKKQSTPKSRICEILPSKWNTKWLTRLLDISLERALNNMFYIFIRPLKVDSLYQVGIGVIGEPNDETLHIFGIVFEDYKVKRHNTAFGEIAIGNTLTEDEICEFLSWNPARFGVGRELKFVESPVDIDISLGMMQNAKGNTVIREIGITNATLQNGMLLAGESIAVAHMVHICENVMNKIKVPTLIIDTTGELEFNSENVLVPGENLKIDPSFIPDKFIATLVAEAVNSVLNITPSVKQYIIDLFGRRESRSLLDMANIARSDNPPGPDVARIIFDLVTAQVFVPTTLDMLPLLGLVDLHNVDLLPRVVYIASLIGYQASAMQSHAGKLKSVIMLNTNSRVEASFMQKIANELRSRGIGVVIRTPWVLEDFSSLIVFRDALLRSDARALEHVGLSDFAKYARSLKPNEAILTINGDGPWLYLPVLSFPVPRIKEETNLATDEIIGLTRKVILEEPRIENFMKLLSLLLEVEEKQVLSILESRGLITQEEAQKISTGDSIIVRDVIKRLIPWWSLFY